MERAKHQLQGRLRYVFGFLRFLFDAACNLLIMDSSVGLQRKNKIFEQGLIDLSNDIDNMINVQWEKVMKITNTRPAIDTEPENTGPFLNCKSTNLSDMTMCTNMCQFLNIF